MCLISNIFNYALFGVVFQCSTLDVRGEATIKISSATTSVCIVHTLLKLHSFSFLSSCFCGTFVFFGVLALVLRRVSVRVDSLDDCTTTGIIGSSLDITTSLRARIVVNNMAARWCSLFLVLGVWAVPVLSLKTGQNIIFLRSPSIASQVPVICSDSVYVAYRVSCLYFLQFVLSLSFSLHFLFVFVGSNNHDLF